MSDTTQAAGLAEVSKEQYARMFGAACDALGEISDHLGIDSDINPGAEPIIEAIDELRAAALRAAPAADAQHAAAWMTPEGDRVVTEITMAGARKDGGASLSSLRPYSVALVRAQAQEAAAALEAPAAAVLYVSPGQLETHTDPDGPESAETGRYLPSRKTPAGKFTQPLYAQPVAAAPQAPAAPAVPWRDCAVCNPPWTDDYSVRVIAITANDDFAGVQFHDVRASDFYGDGTEVTNVCTHWAYRDEIWPRASQAAPAAPAMDARAERDAAFEAVRNRLCGLQRYSFVLDDDGLVRRAQNRTGNWIEFDDAHELFDPVAVDAAIAAQAQGGA